MTAVVAENLGRLRERIAAAAERAGRRADEITLIAVTKRQAQETVMDAVAAGIVDLGENYVQEAAEKSRFLAGGDRKLHWHLIGHLQRNKAKTAVELFDLIQSVDSVALAQTLGRHAVAADKRQEILLQVHLGNEETEFGLAPAQVQDTAAEIGKIASVSLRGLMGIAPQETEARPYFQALRRVFEELPSAQRQTLSMGMTGDFEPAIEEGTTMIRIGTALFGPRL